MINLLIFIAGDAEEKESNNEDFYKSTKTILWSSTPKLKVQKEAEVTIKYEEIQIASIWLYPLMWVPGGVSGVIVVIESTSPNDRNMLAMLPTSTC